MLNEHDQLALMDITYYAGYFKDFDPGKYLAKKDRRARFCDYCEHCKISSTGKQWCDINKNGNGWSRYGVFNKLKGTSCIDFLTRRTIPVVDWLGDDIKPVAGKDYFIWINPKFK